MSSPNGPGDRGIFDLDLPESRKSSSASETDSDDLFFDAEEHTPKSR